MRIYLDLCVYNRPFDNQHQPRVAIETLEILFLLTKAIEKEIILINSFVLEAENSKTPFANRKEKILDILEIASEYVSYSETIKSRANELDRFGLMAMDALHIACAEAVKADFFVTCDDQLVKKARNHKGDIYVNIITLMDFVKKEVFKIWDM